jgi:hypothetical protein
MRLLAVWMTPMKLALKRRSLLVKILLVSACAVVVAIGYFELGHRYNFGHFVPYGLHVDALSEEVSIGIPGQKKALPNERSSELSYAGFVAACENEG